MADAEDSWEMSSQYWNDVDERLDPAESGSPEELGLVCHPGAPGWYNAYKARQQKRVFEDLFRVLPEPSPGARALDVGCGFGRWSRRLKAAGYRTLGVDVREQLVERNRERMPSIEFRCVDIREFESPRPFDLVVSVTVLQHLPPPDQETAAEVLSAAVRPGGHALILENTADHDAHVWPRGPRSWAELFNRHGFECLRIQKYDCNYLSHGLIQFAKSLAVRLGRESEVGDPGERIALRASDGPLASLFYGCLRATVAIDAVIEPFLLGQRLKTMCRHAGLLLRRR